MRIICIVILILLSANAVSQQQAAATAIDLSIFADAANHWYNIKEKGIVIMPRPGHPKHAATAIIAIADNIILFQKDNGGWPKNYDMQAILTTDQQDSLIKVKHLENTTFDNRSTYSHVAYLAKVYLYTQSEKYKTAVLKGLDYIMKSQYENGGWPQYYPLEKNYSRYITFNDDVFAGIMNLLKDITDNKPEYDFINASTKNRIKTTFNKGIDCIIKTQINDTGKPTAWCQQYDEVSLQPAWARKFEPASICNGESVKIVQLLMSIKQPSAAIVEAVQNAVAWFSASKIKGIKVETFTTEEMITPYLKSKTDKRVVADTMAPPIWTRYYELKTHRPLFCNRDSKVVYSLAEVERERRDGYAWYTYEPQKVLNSYPAWQKKFAAGKNILVP